MTSINMDTSLRELVQTDGHVKSHEHDAAMRTHDICRRCSDCGDNAATILMPQRQMEAEQRDEERTCQQE